MLTVWLNYHSHCTVKPKKYIKNNNIIHFSPLIVAPAMNLKIRGVTDRTITLEWEGSVVLTDFLVTYTPSSPGGRYRDSRDVVIWVLVY